MAADRILVIDAGTSSLRALAVGADGDVTPLAAPPWRPRTPADATPFGRELDGAEVASALRELAEAAALHGPYAAVALTGQREGLVFTDDAGRAVCVSPNVDARASAEGMAIDATRAEEVYRATGHLPSLMQAPAKLAWLRQHRPQDIARVTRVLPLADWLAACLAGAAAMSRSLAAENGLLDLATGHPPTYLPQLGLGPALLPSIMRDGAIAGAVATGALAGVPVVLAGADTQCALAGLGAVSPGDCAVPAGWSAPVQCVTEAPLFDADMRTWTGAHVVDGRYVLESNAGETGRAWAWTCELAGVTPDEAGALAATAPVGARDVLTVLGARAMRASAMNAGVGAVLMPLPFVMSSAGRAEVLRAALESVAFAIRANLEQVDEIAGRAVPIIRLGGGMSRSALFAQILSDVLDRAVEVAAHPDATALGAAALASAAVGLHPDVDAAIAAMCGGRRTVEPEARASVEYEDVYARWCAMAGALERMAAEG